MQFRLTTLFWLVALVASAVPAFGMTAAIPAAAVGAALGSAPTRNALLHGRSAPTVIRDAMVVVAVAAVLLALLLPDTRPRATQRHQCANRMRTLLLAMLAYESANGVFPPATVLGDDGAPMHGWRVMLLPYLGEQELYDRYHFNEPWNGPNNSKLANEMPAAFRCAGCERCRGLPGLPWTLPPASSPSFHLVADPKAAVHPTRGGSVAGVTDGASNTILLIESNDRSQNWLAPGGLSLSEAAELLSSRVATRHVDVVDRYWFTSAYSHGFGEVGWCDWHWSSEGPLPENIAASLLTAASGDGGANQITDYRTFAAREYSVDRWDRVVPAMLFVGLVVGPHVGRRRPAADHGQTPAA